MSIRHKKVIFWNNVETRKSNFLKQRPCNSHVISWRRIFLFFYYFFWWGEDHGAISFSVFYFDNHNFKFPELAMQCLYMMLKTTNSIFIDWHSKRRRFGFNREELDQNLVSKFCRVFLSYENSYVYQAWEFFNPLSANPTKWSNTLKQFEFVRPFCEIGA